MKRSILLLVPALFASFLFSCNKSDSGEHNTVTPGGYRSLDEAIASTAPAAKTTSIIVSTGATLVANNGTTFWFPPNIFETQTGGKVTGSVQVTIQDWLKKGDMIFGKVLPLTYDLPLESGGEAYVLVTQNGEVLRIRKGSYIYVIFPSLSTTTGMTGWAGRSILTSSNIVNWQSRDSVDMYAIPATDTLRSDTLHYVQAGMPLSFTDSSNFTVTYTSPVPLEQSMAYAMYDNHKSIFPLPSAINGKISAKNVPAAPGLSLQIVVMGINAGKFYGGYVAVPAPASDSTYTVTVKAIEPPTLRLQLNSLL